MTAQHILVPIDFSEYADQALEYAIVLGKALQAHLTVLHVIHLTPWAAQPASSAWRVLAR